MKFYDLSFVICVSLIVVVTVVGLISRACKGPDNRVEESMEKIIKQTTGVDVDLSPDNGDPDDQAKSDEGNVPSDVPHGTADMHSDCNRNPDC